MLRRVEYDAILPHHTWNCKFLHGVCQRIFIDSSSLNIGIRVGTWEIPPLHYGKQCDAYDKAVFKTKPPRGKVKLQKFVPNRCRGMKLQTSCQESTHSRHQARTIYHSFTSSMSPESAQTTERRNHPIRTLSYSWQRFKDHQYLLVSDQYSKFPVIRKLIRTTISPTIITHLKNWYLQSTVSQTSKAMTVGHTTV